MVISSNTAKSIAATLAVGGSRLNFRPNFGLEKALRMGSRRMAPSKMRGTTALALIVVVCISCVCVDAKKWRSYVDLHDHHSKFSAQYPSSFLYIHIYL